jgi:hypothetical protein
MIASFENIVLPHVICRGESEFQLAFEGLRLRGPYDIGQCPRRPHILFVFPDELKDHANRLFKALREGIGPFTGTQKFFGFELSKERSSRVASFSAPSIYVAKSVQKYDEAIKSHLAGLEKGPKPDIAIIIHPRSERNQECNPYLIAKYPLLAAGISTQVVTSDLIDNENTFKWSVGNIALQLFAKMGGVPWIIRTGLSEDCIVVGINRATVVSPKRRELDRHYGFASVFGRDGVYRETRLFPPANGWNQYLAGFQKSIEQAISDWSKFSKKPVSLVLHVTKEIGRDETTILQKCLSAAGTAKVHDYAVLKLTSSENFLIFDRDNDETFAPPKGILVQLSDRRAILQTNGVVKESRTVGRGGPGEPWQIRLLQHSPDAPPFSRLATVTLALASMNWRALNAQEAPVSIRYPEMAAELLARFAAEGFDIAALTDSPALKRVWFL